MNIQTNPDEQSPAYPAVNEFAEQLRRVQTTGGVVSESDAPQEKPALKIKPHLGATAVLYPVAATLLTGAVLSSCQQQQQPERRMGGVIDLWSDFEVGSQKNVGADDGRGD